MPIKVKLFYCNKINFSLMLRKGWHFKIAFNRFSAASNIELYDDYHKRYRYVSFCDGICKLESRIKGKTCKPKICLQFQLTRKLRMLHTAYSGWLEELTRSIMATERRTERIYLWKHCNTCQNSSSLQPTTSWTSNSPDCR